MPQYAFTTPQVAEMTGLTIRQLQRWAQQETFVPEICDSQGSGTRRLYSLADIIQLKSLRHLQCSRWSTQKLRRAIAMLQEVMNDPHPLRQAMLISDRKTLLVVYKTKQGEQILLDGLLAGGQHVLSLVIETIEAETRQILLNFSSQDNANDRD